MRASLKWTALTFSLLSVTLFACRSPTGPDTDDPRGLGGEPPRQLFAVGDPEIFRHYAPQAPPGQLPDSSLIIRITAPDSTFAIRWWPTEILVETDFGYRKMLRLKPLHCLLRDGPGTSFPLNFTWWACDQVGINTTTVLSPDRLREVVEVAGGDTVYTYRFKTRPGAQYVFGVGTGQAVTADAVRRLSELPEVEAAFRLNADPLCVISDILPPPSCPPWHLVTARPYVFDRVARGDTIPIHRGGWIRATYTQPDGSQRVTTTPVDW